ncbi:MAG: 7-cyano-7-deazaguanine synthase QueC [Gemmatimonadaceae bacterium]
MNRKQAVLLLSGGLDSTTVLALLRAENYDVHALTFSYGQRHAGEIAAARKIAGRHGVVQHVVAEIDLRVFGGSALTADIDVPRDRVADSSHEVPVTYVPARNTIFLSYALALAEVTGAKEIFIGVNALDYSGYPDCRPEFIEAFEKMARLATRAGVEGDGETDQITICTPLIGMTKKQIVELGLSLGANYGMTTSCYDPSPDGRACGHCDACQLRLRGFAEAGVTDPAPYAPSESKPLAT